MSEYIKTLKTKIKNYFNTIWLKGDYVICEMCAWKGKFFPERRCPNCRSFARTRLIPFSINYFNIPDENINMLHVAPNLSEYNFVLDNFNCKIYDRLDITEYSHINLVQDLTNMTVSDCVYDLIIIWHVLEHIPNDYDAISEMYRVLKPKGKLLVSVPIYPINNPKTYEDLKIDRSQFEKIHGHYDHCRSCGLDYYERFESVGFKTEALHVANLDEAMIFKFGLSKNHTTWLFEK